MCVVLIQTRPVPCFIHGSTKDQSSELVYFRFQWNCLLLLRYHQNVWCGFDHPPPAPAPILHSVPQRFLNKLAKIKNLVFLIRPVVTFYCHQTAIENTFALNLIFLGE